jgi:hypothetical protein
MIVKWERWSVRAKTTRDLCQSHFDRESGVYQEFQAIGFRLLVSGYSVGVSRGRMGKPGPDLYILVFF